MTAPEAARRAYRHALGGDQPGRELNWPLLDGALDAAFAAAAKPCPECGGTGEIDVGRHTCGTGPDGHFGHHEPGCGLEPCPAECAYVPPSALPGEAIQAAADAMIAEYPVKAETLRRLARTALEAAAPAIRAHERVRLAALPDDPEAFSRIEPDPRQPGYNQGVFDLTGFAAARNARIAELEHVIERIRDAATQGSQDAGTVRRQVIAILADAVQAEATLKGQPE